MYIAHDQYADTRNWAMKQTLRMVGDPLTVVGQVRAAVREVDPSLVVYRVRTMSGVVDAGISPQRFAMALMTVFAGVAMSLAAVGIYGVLASLLCEVQPTDPWMLAAVAAGVVVLASVAGYLPARRATKVDPVLALRSE